MPDKGSLYQFLPNEIIPPPEVWSRIEHSLNETAEQALLSQLTDWEQTPPPQAWHNIAASLNEAETVSEFTRAEEIQSQEVNPPQDVWKNIQQALERSANIKLSPAKKVARSIWFAAAAAACIGIIFSIVPLLKDRKEGKPFASNITAIVNPVLADTDALNTKTNLTIDPAVHFPEATTAFIKAVGPNGNMVQVSPKLKPLVEFLDDINGAEPIDNEKPTSANELMWKQKLEKWDAMINTSAANAATINFADPIELIRFLEKNQ